MNREWPPRMHPSYFHLLNPAADETSNGLSLSGEVSEWLFHVGLWDKMNARYGTDFAQYEEETLSPSMLESILRLLEELVAGLVDSAGDELGFRYGWDCDRVPLVCSVSIGTIVTELWTLIAFLGKAKSGTLDVYCQL